MFYQPTFEKNWIEDVIQKGTWYTRNRYINGIVRIRKVECANGEITTVTCILQNSLLSEKCTTLEDGKHLIERKIKEFCIEMLEKYK
jgi:hypothetical protein